MQLMPGTAKDMKVENPFDPRDNIRGEPAICACFGNATMVIKEVAAAYNWGLGRVPKRKKLGNLPSETRHYVRKVLKLERKYRQRASK